MRHPPRSVLLAVAVPTAFELDGSARNVDAEPPPTGPTHPTDSTDPPDPGGGAVPALRVSGNKFVAADGTTHRALGGIAWPNDPSQWLTYEPTRPDARLHGDPVRPRQLTPAIQFNG